MLDIANKDDKRSTWDKVALESSPRLKPGDSWLTLRAGHEVPLVLRDRHQPG
jgi:hypothetical protein